MSTIRDVTIDRYYNEILNKMLGSRIYGQEIEGEKEMIVAAYLLGRNEQQQVNSNDKFSNLWRMVD